MRALTYSYQWLRDGVPIAGATSETYALQEADEGATITVTVTASEPDGSAATSATSSATTPVDPASGD